MILESATDAERDQCSAPLQKACDGGHGEACFHLQTCLAWLKKLAHLEPDQAAAARLNSRSCELGFGPGCNASANNHYDGYGVVVDRAQADKLFKRGIELLMKECDADEASSCYVLATIHENPREGPIEASPSEAGRLYGTACELGFKPACSSAARLKPR
jgi:TPR repeat protein